MKSKELIKKIQELDPSGEIEICVGNIDIYSVQKSYASFDGFLQVLEKDENIKTYNVIGAKYKTKGEKITLSTLSISEAIANNLDVPIDYSELSEYYANKMKENHKKLIDFYKNEDFILESEYFSKWAFDKLKEITIDLEDAQDEIDDFFKNNLSPNDPIPSCSGCNYIETRYKQWDASINIQIKNGVISIEMK